MDTADAPNALIFHSCAMFGSRGFLKFLPFLYFFRFKQCVSTVHSRVSYFGFCSTTSMRHILFLEAQFFPKKNGSFLMAFSVLLEYDVNVKQRYFNLLFHFLNEIIARNASYWINVTHTNMLCAFLAIFFAILAL